MVQDTSCSPEIYASRRADGTCGGWGLTEVVQDRGDPGDRRVIDYGDLKECSVVWAVSIPGESQWCFEPLDCDVAMPFNLKSGALMSFNLFFPFFIFRVDSPSLPNKYPMPNTPHIGVQIKVLFSLRRMRALTRSLTSIPIALPAKLAI